jgi:hypothetical protein
LEITGVFGIPSSRHLLKISRSCRMHCSIDLGRSAENRFDKGERSHSMSIPRTDYRSSVSLAVVMTSTDKILC